MIRASEDNPSEKLQPTATATIPQPSTQQARCRRWAGPSNPSTAAGSARRHQSASGTSHWQPAGRPTGSGSPAKRQFLHHVGCDYEPSDRCKVHAYNNSYSRAGCDHRPSGRCDVHARNNSAGSLEKCSWRTCQCKYQRRVA